MLKALILSTLTAALSGAFIATANAGPVVVTGGWGCQSCGYSNGTELRGIHKGSALTSDVSAVILPSGKVVDLH